MSGNPNFRNQAIDPPNFGNTHDQQWKYQYLQEQPAPYPGLSLNQPASTQVNSWLSHALNPKFCSIQNRSVKENDKNAFNEAHAHFINNSSINKENGPENAAASLPNSFNFSNYQRAAQAADHLKELETIRRLDTFLNLSLDKTWDTGFSAAAQPQFKPKEAAMTPPAPGPVFHNYQYNPKSTVNRVKGCLTWDGYLPPRVEDTPLEYSRKVFLGGVPWDVSEQHLELIFSRYGDFKVEWPNNFNAKRNTTKSFLYLVFDSLTSIAGLLADCSKEQHGGSATYNYHMARDKFSLKPIQVIPWIVSDNISMYQQQTRLNNKLTVFVGALHGRLYAQALGHIFEELFHDVAFVQIDTDRYKYPIGSGRVTFSSMESYRKAVEENFLTIIAPKFSKRIQIEPYIEDEPCGKCQIISAPNFCKSRQCFDYFCDNCWGWHHSIDGLKNHIPVKRNRKIERY